MIASLSGEVIDVGLGHGVIECGGVGYYFLATPTTLVELRRGEHARVLTTLVVKEDALTLYGFGAGEDREMFHLLRSVSGFGPKLALAALSVMGAGDLAAAIAGGEVKALQKIPGVGKRMAERLALELKDKVGAFTPQVAPQDLAGAAAPAPETPVLQDVVEALAGLGFSDKVARPVVEAYLSEHAQADNAATLRAALAELGRRGG